MKVSDLSFAQLDYWVAKAEGLTPEYKVHEGHRWASVREVPMPFMPSKHWGQGGPIIEREKITLEPVGDEWGAGIGDGGRFYLIGQTPLVAAMRVFVLAKCGPEVGDP